MSIMVHFRFNGLTKSLVCTINDTSHSVVQQAKSIFNISENICLLHKTYGMNSFVLDNKLRLYDYSFGDNVTFDVLIIKVNNALIQMNHLKFVVGKYVGNNMLSVFSIFSGNVDPTAISKNVTQQLPLEFVEIALENNLRLHMILIDKIFIRKPETIQIYDYLDLNCGTADIGNEVVVVNYHRCSDDLFKMTNRFSQDHVEYIKQNCKKHELNKLNLQVTTIGINIQIPNQQNNDLDDEGKYEYLFNVVFCDLLTQNDTKVVVRSFNGLLYRSNFNLSSNNFQIT